ncbi:hypothetical protein [Streptomyces sp. NPDC007205]|uniref:hypothetical protein n=1 Tax=Streptomyces sp. NPDC007205 TaxID=3154316 RepID=UPI0033F6A22C
MPLRRVAHGLGAFLGAALLCATAATAQAGAVPADQPATKASEASVAPVACGIVDGVEIGDQFTAGNCIDWSRAYGTVEVVGFKLTRS